MVERSRYYFRLFCAYWVWVFKEYFDKNHKETASSLALTSLFALVPLLIVTLSILRLMPQFQGLTIDLQQVLMDNLLPAASTSVSGYLNQIGLQSKGLPLISIIVLVFTSLMMIRSIEDALNKVFDVYKKRPFGSALLLYWGVLSLGPLCIGGATFVSVYLLSSQWLDIVSIGGHQSLVRMVPSLLTLLAIVFFYQVIPYTKVKFWHALVSGIFVTVVFNVFKVAFSWYIVNVPTYTLLYGALAAVPLFILWVYLLWHLFLIGAVMTRAFSAPLMPAKLGHVYRDKFSCALAILQQLYFAQQAKHWVSLHCIEKHFKGITDISLEQVLHQLLKKRYIVCDEYQNYLLHCDLHTTTLLELYRDISSYIDCELSEADDVLHPLKMALSEQMQKPLVEYIKIGNKIES